MKRVLLKLLSSTLVIILLFNVIILKSSNIVQAGNESVNTTTYQEDTAAVEKENQAFDERSAIIKFWDGFVSVVVTPFKLLIATPRINFKCDNFYIR